MPFSLPVLRRSVIREDLEKAQNRPGSQGFWVLGSVLTSELGCEAACNISVLCPAGSSSVKRRGRSMASLGSFPASPNF